MRHATFCCRLIRVQPSSQLSRSMWVAPFALLLLLPSVSRLELACPTENKREGQLSRSKIRRQGCIVQGTRRPRDASSERRVDQGTHRPKDVAHLPRGALIKGRNIRDFSFGDTPIGNEITIGAYLQDRAWVTAL
jgi:hypothetical protein